jgi:hypothetical protein
VCGREGIDQHPVAAAGIVFGSDVDRRYPFMPERGVDDTSAARLDRSLEQRHDGLAIRVDRVQLGDVEASRQLWH